MTPETKRAGSAGRYLSLAYTPAAVALIIILLAGVFAERQSRALAQHTLRNEVTSELGRLRGNLEVAVADQFGVVERLAGAVAADPGMSAGRFSEMAGILAGRETAVRAIAAAPAGGQTMIHSRGVADGRALATALQRAPPGRAGASSLSLAAAPALALWAPVAAEGAEGAAPWGLLGVAVDARALFARAGLPTRSEGLVIQLTGRGSSPAAPMLQFGPDVLHADPVTVRIALPGYGWRLSAVPSAGWRRTPAVVWLIRLITLLAAAAIVGPMMRTRRLIDEREGNIAALRDREAQLARLSRRLELALDASKVAVWDLDLTTNELVWDARMDELYGFAPDGRAREVSDWRNRLHPEDAERAASDFSTAIAVTGRYNSQYRLVLPDGSGRHIHAIGAVYRETDGAKIVGVNWDVTAEVLRNTELVVKRREAEAASVAKSQFLATMSHEIRTPMNGVIGMLDLMLRAPLDPEQRARALVACDSATHLLAILNDILDFSKLEADGVALEPTDADPAQVVRDVVALMSAGAQERAIRLEVTVAPRVPRWVVCDPTRLRQVLVNLVGNAIKFTEAGVVGIDVAHDDGALRIAVRDTGVGISEAAQQTLFQRFAQIDSSITRERGGTGLGLAISKQLVELMGGGISVESAPGLGSSFRFWIAAPPGAPPKAAAQAQPRIAAAGPVRVLVAEDNATNQQILRAYLTTAGHSVEIVCNGAEALAEVQRAAFDLLIMDVQMPVMDGITATGLIRALPGPPAAIPIIALTANAMRGDRETCLAAGMTDYVSKPIAAEALHAAIARALPALRGAPRAQGAAQRAMAARG